MAMEPINIFTRNNDLPGIARRLRELAKEVTFDGPDDRWQTAVVTFKTFWKKRTLTLKHNPTYYSEPNWARQMAGMQGYFSRFPDTPRKQTALLLPTTFKFALSTEFDPDFDPNSDPRLDVVYAVTAFLDGVIFTPSGFRDANGRILFGSRGTQDEDPLAVWPRVIAEVKVAQTEPTPDAPDSEDDEEASEPPTAKRVARRALALTVVTARAVLEWDSEDPKAKETYQQLLAWMDEIGIERELEPEEAELVQKPLGELDPQEHSNAVWRLEGLGVLAWALGKADIPPHDQTVQQGPLLNSLGILNPDVAEALLLNPTLRPREELKALQNRLFALHWRLRSYHLDRKVMDFAEQARTAWFGPLDISGLPLIEGDLAIAGKRIDRVAPNVLSAANSAAQERHQAINWLCDGPELYSQASVST